MYVRWLLGYPNQQSPWPLSRAHCAILQAMEDVTIGSHGCQHPGYKFVEAYQWWVLLVSPLTKCNFWAKLTAPCHLWFGNHGRQQNARSLLGWSSKIEFRRLIEKRGWPNYRCCKICNQAQETGSRILFKCQFNIRIWYNEKEGLGLQDVDPSSWHHMCSIKVWWGDMIHNGDNWETPWLHLPCWCRWRFDKKEMHVFRNITSTSKMFVSKIKNELATWGLTGAKALTIIMPWE
jgi:hypothetical protein